MLRSAQLAPVSKSPFQRNLRRTVGLWGLLLFGLGLAGALFLVPRYRERQRQRQEAAERARWAQAARDKTALAEEANELPALVDRGPVQLAGLVRGVRALTSSLAASSPERSLPMPSMHLEEPAAKVLANLSARPGLPWLPPLLHGAPIHDAGLSADGALLLTAGGDGVVRIHDGLSGRKLAQLRLAPRAGAAQLARFSPDGGRVVTAGADGTVQLWEARTGRALMTVGLDLPPGAIRDLAFAPDGRLLVVATATGTSYLVDPRTGAPTRKLTGHRDEVTMSSFSPDGLRVVTASADGTVRMFAVASGATLGVWKAHPLGARVARFSPDGSLVATAGNEATVRLFHTRSLLKVAELHGHRSEVLSVRFSPDSTQLVTASADGTALLWDSRTGRLLASLVGHTHPLSDAVFAPDGAAVLTAAVDGEARLWTVPSGKTLAVLRGHRARLTAIEFKSDGESVLTAGLDGAARMWTARPLAGVAPERLMHHAQLTSAGFSPSSDAVVTTGRDGLAELWDPRDGRHRRTLAGHAYAVNAAVFSPDGRRLITGSDDGSARVWDARSGLALHTLLGHTHPVRSLSVSADGLLAVTVDALGIARLWSVRDAQALGLLGEGSHGPARLQAPAPAQAPVPALVPAGLKVAAAVFSPDGERLATLHGHGTAQLWNVHTLALQASLPHGSTIHLIDFSPDGSRALTAGADRLVRLWDTRAGAPAATATLEGHSGELLCARFSPDGLRVLTGAADHTSRIWDAATGQPVVTLSEHKSAVQTAALSPDGLRALTGDSNGLAVLWEATTGKVLRRFEGTGAVIAVAFSADGHSLLLGRSEGDVQVIALSAVPLLRGACRLLRNHDAQWAKTAAACQSALRDSEAVALPQPPGDGGVDVDLGLWAKAPPAAADGGAAETAAWRRDLAPHSHEIPAGCFAFSAKLHAAACRVRQRAPGSARERIAVAFVPPIFAAIPIEPEVGDSIEPRCPPLAWGPSLTTLQERLLAGDFAPVAASAYRPLHEGPQGPLGTSGASFSWLPEKAARPIRKDAREPHVWTLQVRCSSGKQSVLQTYTSRKEEVTAAVAPSPDGKYLLFRIALSTLGSGPGSVTDQEGGRPYGRQEKVIVLDPRSCAVQSPVVPAGLSL